MKLRFSTSMITLPLSLLIACVGYADTGVSEAIIKKIITDREAKTTTFAVGDQSNFVRITFDSIQFGKAHKANKAEEFDGIPAGETIYPVRVKWTTTRWSYECLKAGCQNVAGGSKRIETDNTVNYDYGLYKNRFGEWTTIGYGPVR